MSSIGDDLEENPRSAENRPEVYGTYLKIIIFPQLGWKINYWNPNPSKNAQWDVEDRELNPLNPGRKWLSVCGGHALRYASVKNQGIYQEPGHLY
jgi:hypothetical protein